MDFQEFVEMMIKVGLDSLSCTLFMQRENDKETEYELKQAFRVLDKVSFCLSQPIEYILLNRTAADILHPQS